MNQREKLLALIAGGLIGIFAIAYLGMSVTRMLSSYETRKRAAEDKLHQTQLEIAAGQLAAEELQTVANRALPPQREVARSLYSQWLVNLVTQAGLANASIDADTVTANKDIFDVHTFTVSGAGDLRQITSLLAQLETADVAHRVQRLSFRPIRDKKQLDVALTLEVLAMPTAPSRTQLPKPPADSPAKRPAQQFVLARNLFAPENQLPALTVQPTYTAFVGQRFRLQPEGSDPDKLDKVQFESDVSALANASVAKEGGTIEWTPKSVGEYTIKVAALDDGIPQRRTEREVKITVREPEAPPPAAEKPDLTAAKFAVITGVTTTRGRPEVWLSLRTEGRTLKLGVGDTFKLGTVDASVTAINAQNVEIDAAGQRIRAKLGQSLADSGLK